MFGIVPLGGNELSETSLIQLEKDCILWRLKEETNLGTK